MERAVEEALNRAKTVYEMVTGQPAPEFAADSPYARIPPEVDREDHVLRQAAALFERVRVMDQKVSTTSVVSEASTTSPFAMFREGNELCFTFEIGPISREKIGVELQGTLLRVSTEKGVRTACLPVRVEPNAVSAEFNDGYLVARVRIPAIDDATHKIEIR